jgi:hypothetical protein
MDLGAIRKSIVPDSKTLAVRRLKSGESAEDVAKCIGLPKWLVERWAKSAAEANADANARKKPSTTRCRVTPNEKQPAISSFSLDYAYMPFGRPALNHITDPDKKATALFRVKSGESVEDVAKSYNLPLGRVKSWVKNANANDPADEQTSRKRITESKKAHTGPKKAKSLPNTT